MRSRQAWRWDFTCCVAAGYGEDLIEEVARVMEYSAADRLYRDDVEVLQPAVAG